MRRFSYLLLAVCLCLPLAGCGGDSAPAGGESDATSEAGGDAGSGSSEGGSESKPAESEEAASE